MSFNFEKTLITVLQSQNGKEEPVMYDPVKSKHLDYRRNHKLRFHKKSKASRKADISSFRSRNKRFCEEALLLDYDGMNDIVEPILKGTSG